MKKILIIIKKYFNIYIAFIRQFEEKETEILVKNMPSWYVTYQYGFFSRACRVLAMLCLSLIFHHHWLLENINENIYDLHFILNYIEKKNLLAIYSVLTLISGIFLALHCIFNAIIRVRFFLDIVINSPISFIQYIVTGSRVWRYIVGFLAIMLGIPTLDFFFTINNNVAVLKGIYMKYFIQFFGANATNCRISTGETFDKEGITYSLAKAQEYTLYREKIANEAYNNAINQGMNKKETTAFVIEALKNN